MIILPANVTLHMMLQELRATFRQAQTFTYFSLASLNTSCSLLSES